MTNESDLEESMRGQEDSAQKASGNQSRDSSPRRPYSPNPSVQSECCWHYVHCTVHCTVHSSHVQRSAALVGVRLERLAGAPVYIAPALPCCC